MSPKEPTPPALAETALVAVGLRPGDRVRFRRREGGAWHEATVERRERDGSIGVRDARGAARALTLDRLQVRATGPRGDHLGARGRARHPRRAAGDLVAVRPAVQRRTVCLDEPATELPLALARLHGSLEVGMAVELHVAAQLPVQRLLDLVAGAGFAAGDANRAPAGAGRERLRLLRQRSLADTVGADMGLLVCGLNPSLTAADAGVGFFTAGNRFWPAALAAGLVSRDRDPVHALTRHGVGMTDLVKRATPRADALTAAEYQRGLARLERLCAWLAPAVVCFVGLAGWRAAVDRRACAGPQDRTIGGRPAYVMPSTSGANATSSLAALSDHLRAARALSPGA